MDIISKFEDKSGIVYLCEKCEKPLIQRLSNGLWKFKYGRHKIQKDGETIDWSPVEFLCHGSMRFKCFRKECGHWNSLNFVPYTNEVDVVFEIQELISKIEDLANRLPLIRKKQRSEESFKRLGQQSG